MRRIVLLVVYVALGTLLAVPSHAQVGTPFDHLKCYKVKDRLFCKCVPKTVEVLGRVRQMEIMESVNSTFVELATDP